MTGVLALLLCLALAGTAAARTFTDDAGRQVELPDRIARVFAAGPPASIVLYTLAPDRLLGWTRAPRADEREFLAAPWRDLPETGRLTGRANTANVEEVLRLAPDLILDIGSTDATYASLADRVQRQTGVPYILLDGRFAATLETYRKLGELVSEASRAGELAAEARRVFADIDERLARVPAEKRRRVYYARSPTGLETGLAGSINTEMIERAGGLNVAAAAGRGGLATVSREQVLSWDPEIIVMLDDRFLATIERDPVWRAVAAVRQRNVHVTPKLPFGWVDSPPSVNRLIGLRWLAGLFYPDLFPEDLREETRRFYRLFYHLDLDEAQIDRLLGRR
jgi:iron complex transport system substrate-binding protein